MNFYKGVDGIVLVFDLTNENSFSNIPHWIRQIKLYATENVPILLLGNKCDIVDEKKVEMGKIEELCEEYNLKYIETSAKLNINIEKAFICIVKELTEKAINPNNISNPSLSAPIEADNKKKSGIKLSNTDDISDISQCQC